MIWLGVGAGIALGLAIGGYLMFRYLIYCAGTLPRIMSAHPKVPK